MWIDEYGIPNTVHVDPAALLGDDTAEQLESLDSSLSNAVCKALTRRDGFDAEIAAEVAALALPPDPFAEPPEFTGFLVAPTSTAESLSDDIWTFLATVEARWRYEVREAFIDLLSAQIDLPELTPVQALGQPTLDYLAALPEDQGSALREAIWPTGAEWYAFVDRIDDQLARSSGDTEPQPPFTDFEDLARTSPDLGRAGVQFLDQVPPRFRRQVFEAMRDALPRPATYQEFPPDA